MDRIDKCYGKENHVRPLQRPQMNLMLKQKDESHSARSKDRISGKRLDMGLAPEVSLVEDVAFILKV